MRIGASLMLIAVGAILKFAVTKHVSGINIQTVGVVLMIIGIAGLVFELIMWGTRRRTTVVDSGMAYVDPRMAAPVTPVAPAAPAAYVDPRAAAPAPYVAQPLPRRTTYIAPNDPADLM